MADPIREAENAVIAAHVETLVGHQVEAVQTWVGGHGDTVYGLLVTGDAYEADVEDDEGHVWHVDPATIKEA